MVPTTQSLPPTISIDFFQVRGSVTAVTNTVGFRSLIALHVDIDLLVPLPPLGVYDLLVEVGHLHVFMVHHRDASHASGRQE